MIVLIPLLTAIIVSMVVIVSAKWHNTKTKRKLEAKKTAEIKEQKDARYWSTVREEADGFYNLVKDSLPRDLGLIYELEVVNNSNRGNGGYNCTFFEGEQVVIVKVYDPILDKDLGKLQMSERVAYRDSSSYKVTEFRYETLPGKIKEMVQADKRKELVGRKEIIS